MDRTHPRQKLRKGLIFALFLFFPLLYNFLSPYLIIDGAMQGVLAGSPIVFGLMFLSSLLLGRAYCGWACSPGGMQEACFSVQNKPVSQRVNWIKWLIWVPWLALVVLMFILAGGIQRVDPLHKIDLFGVMQPYDTLRFYMIYFIVVGLIFTLSLTVGRRAFCHTGCWMSPFMIIGRWLRNRLRLPALQLRVQPEKCSDCKTCIRGCPMSLDVNALVHSGNMEHSECILCGSCVDACNQGVIRFDFGRPVLLHDRQN